VQVGQLVPTHTVVFGGVDPADSRAGNYRGPDDGGSRYSPSTFTEDMTPVVARIVCHIKVSVTSPRQKAPIHLEHWGYRQELDMTIG
jgi:hypothetical protein